VSRAPRALLATLAVGALAVSGIGTGSGTGSPAGGPQPTPTPAVRKAPDRPNILLVTVDDLSYRDVEHMPNLRREMERRGVTFADAVAPSPICVPARASLLTGQYAHNHGARTIKGPHGGYQHFRDEDTVATALQGAGYETLFAGKYLNGYGSHGTAREVPPGWSHWRGLVGSSTYAFFDPRVNVDGHLRRAKGYSTHITTRHAHEMIEQARTTRKPWFAWVNYVAPHTGSPDGPGDPRREYAGTDRAFKTTVPAPRDRGTKSDQPLPAHPNMFPSDTSQLPAASPSHRQFNGPQRKALRTVYQRRLEAAVGLDRAIGNTFAFLRKKRLLSKTLVVFTSDNGYAVGEHNINGKLWGYDETARIPVLMRGPGVPRGVTVRTPVTNPDLAATILGAAGVAPPRDQDGIDIRPWLRAPDQVRVVPLEAWKVKNGDREVYRGVRVGPWTYVRYDDGTEELYDRSRDPYELHNLAGREEHARTRAALAALTQRYRECAGSDCPQDLYAADRPLDVGAL